MTTQNELFSSVVLRCLKKKEDISVLKRFAISRFRINQEAASELLADEKFIFIKRGLDEKNYIFFKGNDLDKINFICSQNLESLTISELLISYELLRIHIQSEDRIISTLVSKTKRGFQFTDRLDYYINERSEHIERREDILEEIVYRLNITQKGNTNWYLEILKICKEEVLRNENLAKKVMSNKKNYVKRLKVNQI